MFSPVPIATSARIRPGPNTLTESPMPKNTTANEPVNAIDPGGTRPAKGKSKATTKQTVKSGDRNMMPSKKTEARK